MLRASRKHTFNFIKMKSTFWISSCLLLLLIFVGCQKENTPIQPNVVNAELLTALDRTLCPDCLCKAPNGATLPCSELANWEDYTYDYIPGLDPDDLSIPEAPRWKYLTLDCDPDANGDPQIKCIKRRNGDCRLKFDCTLCANCK
jgi:hypothetical protein